MKRFWREGLFVAIAVMVLDILVDFIPIEQEILSPTIMLFGVFVLVLPIFPAALAGFWIRKKTSAKDYLVVPALGAILGGVLLVGFSLVQLMLLDDASILLQMQQISKLGITSFEGMSVQEFRSFVIASSFAGLVVIAIINGAVGLFGGLAGGFLASRNKGNQ